MPSGGERTRRLVHGVGPRGSLTDARMTPDRPERGPTGLATWPEQPVCHCQVRVARCPYEEAALGGAGRASVREPRGPTPCTNRRVRSPPEGISYDRGVNQATGWRFALAERIGASYPPKHNAQVVMVAGSIGRGDPTPPIQWD